MTYEEVRNMLIKNASEHGADEIECCIAGWREDVHKDFYTWGEVLNALITEEGWVWEHHVSKAIETIINHPEIFDK